MPEQLIDTVRRHVPMNAYFTPVKWLSPIYVAHTKGEIDVMLSSPLYFDVDFKDAVPPTFHGAKMETMRLMDFIDDQHGRHPDLVVFSGRQGFHVYFWNWDFNEIEELAPDDRISEFKRKRSQILAELKQRNICVDPRVTADPYRIMRIPYTLHGTTGLIAKSVNNVEAFDAKESCAFDPRVHETVFGLDWKTYE